MLHAREDYNRFQDPEGLIPDDEPVFLLRGQDHLAPYLLEKYANELRQIGGSEEMAKIVENHALLMRKWQEEHKSKIPDM